MRESEAPPEQKIGLTAQSAAARLRCSMHGPDDAFMRAASAQVFVQCVANCFASGMWGVLQQRARADQYAAEAIPALASVLFHECLLQGIRVPGGAQPLEGGDVVALHRPERQVA